MNDLDSGSIFLPRIQLMAIGMPYETPRATTDAEMMALNALFEVRMGFDSELGHNYLLDPKNIQPKITTSATVR